MTAKHTPGPWKVVRSGLWEGAVCSDGYTPTWIGRKADESLANAQIISAAPDLLGCVEHAQAWISDMPHGDNCYLSSHYDGDPGNQCNCGKDSMLHAFDAAIAKATGEQP